VINVHTYDNGLRLVSEKIPSVRSVSMGVWIGTGSKYEAVHNNGVSHFIEHMLFKGTKTRTARQIAEAFDRIGGNLNAFTSKELTCYYAKILDQHLPFAVEVLADMFFHSSFDEHEFQKERRVILEELKMYEDAPDEVVHDLISAASFPKHPLGATILGNEQVLSRLTPHDLRSYMAAHYDAKNVVIAVAGNIEHEALIQLINQHFSSIIQHDITKEITTPQFEATHMHKQKETEQAHFCIGLEGLPIGHKDMYALILLNNLLGGSMSSRLFQEIREERGLAYSVYSYHTAYKEAGTITLYAGTAPEQLTEVYELCINILQDLAKNGMSNQELHHGKEQLKGNLMLSLESTNSRMSRIAKNELLLKRHLSLDELVERIEAVKIDDLNYLAHRLFTQQHSFALVSPFDRIPEAINLERPL